MNTLTHTSRIPERDIPWCVYFAWRTTKTQFFVRQSWLCCCTVTFITSICILHRQCLFFYLLCKFSSYRQTYFWHILRAPIKRALNKHHTNKFNRKKNQPVISLSTILCLLYRFFFVFTCLISYWAQLLTSVSVNVCLCVHCTSFPFWSAIPFASTTASNWPVNSSVLHNNLLSSFQDPLKTQKKNFQTTPPKRKPIKRVLVSKQAVLSTEDSHFLFLYP